MAAVRKRPCRYCRRWFLPDVRVGERQRACGSSECQRRRQAENERTWLERHPGYFRGREVKHRAWRAAHPDAKRRWRAANPEARERERLARARRRREAATSRAVEQEAIALQLVAGQGVGQALAPAVEPKEIVPQLRVLLGLASALPPAGTPKPIVGALAGWEARGRRLLAGARRHASCASR